MKYSPSSMILMQMLSFADGRYTGHDMPTEARRVKTVYLFRLANHKAQSS